ncbi:hypothetical protein ACFQ0K_14365 [Nocardioides caeni]|uniref:GlsB/YeaQ/YmgE family stress response membrane protein n=1 Tax=Nocardioides caeni TaxID=574700 RepID=A0A4V4HKJ0_9ACTN|nr:hypothetical protein [Nocardioides caeni]THV14566.1 hypothetical protein E9934_07790 [Nocardioides caeni]
MLWTIIVTIVGGTIIGLLGKAVAPGDRTRFPLWLTMVCGIVGMLAGSLLYWVLFGHNNGRFDDHPATWDNTTNGIDWLRHLWQVGVAAAAVVVAATLTGRKKV